MTKILVVASTSRHSERVIDEAFLQARDDPKAEITLLYVLETNEIDKIRSQMESSGFLGEKPTEEVIHALKEERKSRRKKYIQSFEKMADMAKVPSRAIEVSGNYSEKVIEHVEKEAYDFIFMVKSKQSFLSRLIHGSDIDKIVRYTRAKKESRIRLIE